MHVYDVPKILLKYIIMYVMQKVPASKTLMPEERPATKKRLSVKVIKI